MKIILVVTDRNGKNVGFVSDDTRAYSLEETFRLIKSGKLDAHIVKGQHGNYLRSTPNANGKDNLDYISVSGRDIIFYAQGTSRPGSTPAITNYLKKYLASLNEGQPFIIPVDRNILLDKFLKAPTIDVKNRFAPHTRIITEAAKEFNIDNYLLGAIMIDEIARLLPFEQILDPLFMHVLGRNVSVGIMQVTLETANQLIKKDFYNPNPTDRKLPFKGVLSNEDRAYLYKYVLQTKHNVRFAAAYIHSLIDEWKRVIDVSQKPEIIATLYNRIYREPNPTPKASERGEQIATEFYQLAKKWLT